MIVVIYKLHTKEINTKSQNFELYENLIKPNNYKVKTISSMK